MGRGDKKTKKGKQFKGSFGNSRNRNDIKAKMKRTASKKQVVAKAASETVKPKAKRVVKKKETAAE